MRIVERLLRGWVDVVSALTTALFLLLDLLGMKSITGWDVPWQLLALSTFLVFVCLVYARVLAMYRDLHARERDLYIEVSPEPGPSGTWSALRDVSDMAPGELVSGAMITLAVTNTGDADRTITRALLEFRKTRWLRVGSALLRKPLPVLTRDGEVLRSAEDGYVGWRVPAGGPREVHSIGFRSSESGTEDHEVTGYDVYLVLEVGSPEYSIRRKVAGPR